MQNVLDPLDDTDALAMTHVRVTHFKFKWTVADIHQLSLLDKPPVSPPFKIPFLSECSLKLAWDSSQRIVVELLLKTVSENEKWSCTLYDKKGQEMFASKSYALSTTTKITSEAVLPPSSFPGGVLVILCDFSSNKVQSDLLTFQSSLYSNPRDNLASDFQAMYDHPRYTDVVLRVDGEEVKAHKAILSARSSVFKKMFQSPMSEKEDGVVEIDDIELSPFKQFLGFLYTGSVDLSEDPCDVYPLYYAADKYKVMDLKCLCAEAMRSKLNFENALCLFAWADRHRDEVLKASVMDFVSWNFKKVVDSDDWSSFVTNQSKEAALLVKHCLDKWQE